MFLFNEQNEPLSVKDAKVQLKDLSKLAVPTEADVRAALGEYYNRALQLQSKRFEAKATLAPAGVTAPEAFLPGIGAKILAELKKIICGILDGNSTEDEILQAVLGALATIIPGGVFIKALANIVVKYLLSLGIGAFCGVAPVVPAGN